MKKLSQLFSVFLLVAALSVNAQTENLKIDWAKEYKWKVGADQENEQLRMIEWIPKKENLENWTIIATTLILKNKAEVGAQKMMDASITNMQKSSKDAKLTEIERDDNAKYPYIIFKIEAPVESQLYYIVQGKQHLYTSFVALKAGELSADFIQKWLPIFKASKITK